MASERLWTWPEATALLATWKPPAGVRFGFSVDTSDDEVRLSMANENGCVVDGTVLPSEPIASLHSSLDSMAFHLLVWHGSCGDQMLFKSLLKSHQRRFESKLKWIAERSEKRRNPIETI